MTEFTKAHGNGNDFVIVDEWNGERVDENDKSGFAERYCDRRRGIGGDGVVFLSRASEADADARMRLYQPDGDPVEMCGNALRCIARFCVDRGYFGSGEAFVVGTGAGNREVSWDGERATVEMGAPSFDADDVPARGDGVGDEVVEENVAGRVVTAVNTGVPHAVVFVDDVAAVDVKEEAPPVRHADVFPEGANVNFVENDGDTYRARTFERGVEGETLACGTGAVAVAAVARQLRGAGDEVRVGTRGGTLAVEFADDVAYLRGDAELVYEGETL